MQHFDFPLSGHGVSISPPFSVLRRAIELVSLGLPNSGRSV